MLINFGMIFAVWELYVGTEFSLRTIPIKPVADECNL